MNDSEFRDNVLQSLARMETKLDSVCANVKEHDKKIDTHAEDIAALKVKSGFVGGVSGAFTGFGMAWIKSLMGG
jgi:hypothetical protein